MRITRKIAVGAAATALGAGSLIGVGVTSAAHAGAAPAKHHVHCTQKHGKPYPPGKCFVTFSKGKYHRGDTVKYDAATFPAHHKVKAHLQCKSFGKKVDTAKAGGGGEVSSSFTLPNKTPKGHCTLTVHGGGSSVEGSFKAKH